MLHQTLRKRLEALKALREKEAKGENDYRYISDLDLSIDSISKQLDEPEKPAYQMVKV